MEWQPLTVEVDAAERALVGAGGTPVDGFWRSLGEAILVDAHEAGELERAGEREVAGARG